MFEFSLFTAFKIIGLMVFATTTHSIIKSEGPPEYIEDYATIIIMAVGGGLFGGLIGVIIAAKLTGGYTVPIAAAILIIFNILIAVVPEGGSLFGTFFGEDPRPGPPRHSRAHWNPTPPQPQPAPERVVAFEAIDTGYPPLFHGTKTVEGAFNIYYTRQWVVEDHEPHGIYVTTDINIAIGHAGTNGYIIQVYVDGEVKRQKTANTCYAILLPKRSAAKKKPYLVEGVVPVAIFDLTGKRLESREGA